MREISPRLKSLVSFIPKGSKVADIGTGHASLAIYLVTRNICPRVIATDSKVGPIEASKAEVSRARIGDRLEIRMGEGLKPLAPHEVQCIVVAGMGGNLISRIISESPGVARNARLVLGPMTHQPFLRRWLLSNGYRIEDEDLTMEGQRIYETIVAVSGCQSVDREILYEIGPCLWEKRHPLLGEFLNRKAAVYHGKITEMAKSRNPAIACKMADDLERLREIYMMKGVLRHEAEG